MRRVVIAGAGLAGLSVASGLRSSGYSGEITVLNGEAVVPYDRPQLSKGFMQGTELPQVQLLWSQKEFIENDTHLMNARLMSIDTAACTVECTGGVTLDYDALVLATGSRARRLNGEALANYYYLRTYEDALQIRAVLNGGGNVVCIGGGVIGLELASAAREKGRSVDVVEMGDSLLGRLGNPSLSEDMLRLCKKHGVSVHLGRGVVERRSDSILLDDGCRLSADAFLVGIGVEREIEFARHAGLAVGQGILVDGDGRTSVENIFAAGEVAEYPHPVTGQPSLSENWKHAMDHGAHVGRAVAGAARPFAAVEWVWSDQFGVNIQIAGDLSAPHREIVRGDRQGDQFVVFSLAADNTIRGAYGFNAGAEISATTRLIQRNVKVEPDRLANPENSLRDFFKQKQNAS